jgi:hypothetical protein
MSGFVYFTGSADGELIKIGHTRQPVPWGRAGQTKLGHSAPIPLCAVRGSVTAERSLHAHFAGLAVGDEVEIFRATPELVGYVNWLRQQWFTWADTEAADGPDDEPDWRDFMPEGHHAANGAGRCIPLEPPEPGAMLQHYDVTSGPYRDTPWAGLTIPPPDFNDYYTPPELVAAARLAMGGLDLDPASHWSANRVHRAGTFYHKHRSGPWFGRVWLNPPYGDNQAWFEPILRYWLTDPAERAAVDAEQAKRVGITQLCMLSPVWAFNTGIAAPVTRLASAFLLLGPAPKFWGQNREGKRAGPDRPIFGSDHPHAILYLGDRAEAFRDAYRGRGLFMTLDPAELGTGADLGGELEGS